MIDLHVHTNASDGLHAPHELLELAASQGVRCVAITDHDTAAGVRALGAGNRGERESGSEVIAGIEVSAEHEGVEVHVLGYFIDPNHARLLEFEQSRALARRRRVERMVERLVEAGFALRLEDVFAQRSGPGPIGRPHVARALVAGGFVESVGACFKHWLSPGGRAFVPYSRPSVSEAAALIRAIGGVVVLAHPALDRVERMLEDFVSELDGLEVDHPAHAEQERLRLRRYAEARGLLPTAGSDFHGVGVSEGAEIGSVPCPGSWLAALRGRARGGTR